MPSSARIPVPNERTGEMGEKGISRVCHPMCPFMSNTLFTLLFKIGHGRRTDEKTQHDGRAFRQRSITGFSKKGLRFGTAMPDSFA